MEEKIVFKKKDLFAGCYGNGGHVGILEHISKPLKDSHFWLNVVSAYSGSGLLLVVGLESLTLTRYARSVLRGYDAPPFFFQLVVELFQICPV